MDRKRKAVLIKERIAAVMMFLGVMLILSAGCTIDVSNDYKLIIKTGLVGLSMCFIGYKAYIF